MEPIIEPKISSNPPAVSEPRQLSNPKRTSEPITISNPKRKSEPPIMRKPFDISEPASMSKPPNASEPSAKSNPSCKSEPPRLSKPKQRSEPVTPSNPNCKSEPPRLSNPLVRSEPHAASNPLNPSEPLPNEPNKGDGNELLGDFGKAIIRHAIESYYDNQALRKAQMNRIRIIVRKRNEGRKLNEIEPKQDAKNHDAKYADDKLPKLIDEMKLLNKLAPHEYETILKMLAIAKSTAKLELGYKNLLKPYVFSAPIYGAFLCTIRGLKAPILSGGLIAWLDPSNAPHQSSFRKYAGFHVVNGAAPKRTRGQKTDYNPRLRTHCWKIMDGFIKHRTPKYRDIYDARKLEYRSRHCGGCVEKVHACRHTGVKAICAAPKKHIDYLARRPAIKQFLDDLWIAWRTLEKLPTSPAYNEVSKDPAWQAVHGKLVT